MSGRPVRIAVVVVVALCVAALGSIAVTTIGAEGGPLASFEQQLCSVPEEWLELTRRGHFEARSGQISLLPRTPMYMTTGGKGWTHSGPWPYLQEIPLVFYGPGVIDHVGEVRPPNVTLADVAPTIAALIGMEPPAGEGRVLKQLIPRRRRDVRLVVTVVWDGGGLNALSRWPNSWPTLEKLMLDGAVIGGTVGSSPSVTPAVHTTLGTGVFPWKHGVTDVPVRNDEGTVVDAFYENSARFIEVPTVAELWDEANDNRALIGMVGYEPWHLGMIGKGAEAPGGDRDHAVWMNRARNTWVTRRDYYEIPATFRDQSDLDGRLEELDRSEGRANNGWMRVPLDERSRIEETPAFIAHHADKLIDMIDEEGYGDDGITDLLFTNFKQIDRLAHYFSMDAPEVRAMVEASDRALGTLIDHLDGAVGRGRYVVVLTADHGLQPDDEPLDAYAIDPNEVERDIATEFGPIVKSVWPTAAFLLDDEMTARGIRVEDVANFLGDYRLRDNATRVDQELLGAGRFDPGDRVFDFAVPAGLLDEIEC